MQNTPSEYFYNDPLLDADERLENLEFVLDMMDEIFNSDKGSDFVIEAIQRLYDEARQSAKDSRDAIKKARGAK